MDESMMRSNERLVVLGRSFKDSSEVIACLAGLAREEGFVEELFVTSIQERELEYPTGLAMPVPLAIPHIGDGCAVPFVSVATLDPPVVFKSMDRSGDDVHARIVFLFGILEPKSQLAVLRKFARAFANGDDVGRLAASDTPGALLRELNGILGGMLNVGR
ncbi:MAG: PTS sugar transporter subunit IIA [Synergistaceae bacterium]|jgi:PTS system galactitol-specific IIA component|nr:PTS sugar transporter subunit IIA [Synergistaceae bacterium]